MSDAKKRVSKKGHIIVAPKLVAEAGIAPLDKVTITSEPNKITIAK